ncbi:hypothetical protein M885DRAFT_452913 [Pelagophyceae sp. CCMP2097]|nr:hypothetical protein M885DRAFT_452913 [Pelagophyceae sp. CCMP2097]
MLQKGLSDSATMNWWRAIAQGFTAMGLTAQAGARNVGEALRELTQLKSKRDFELASISALLFFHQAADRIDDDEVRALRQHLSKEDGRASEVSLLLAAQFRWFCGVHAQDSSKHRDELDAARELITRVAPSTIVAQTGMQKQAHTLLAWVDLSMRCASRAEVEQRKQAVRYLEGSNGREGRDLDVLMARAAYYDAVGEPRKALDELHQAVASQASFVPALVEKAKLLVFQGDWDQAMEACARVLALNERNCDALKLVLLCDLTQKAASSEVVVDQIRAVGKSLDRYEPRNAALYLSTAKTLARVSSRKPAVLKAVMALTEKAATLRPGDSTYSIELAHQVALQGDFPGACLRYRGAGESDEANLTALHGVIYCQIMSGEIQDAADQIDFLSAMEDSMEATATLPLLKAVLAWRHEKDGDKHVKLLRAAESAHFGAVDRSPEEANLDAVYSHFARLDPDFVLELSREYLEHVEYELADFLGDREEVPPQEAKQGEQFGNRAAVLRGIDLLEKLSARVPGLLEAKLLVARAKFALRQFAPAQRALGSVLALDAKCADAHLINARIAVAQGSFGMASDTLENAVACNFLIRKNPMYLLAAAQIHAERGAHDDALTDLEAALKTPGVRDGAPPGAPGGGLPASERAAIFVELASTLAKLKQFEQAHSILAEAHERFKETAAEIVILMASSSVAIQRNDFDGAVRMLNGVPQNSRAYVHAQMVKANYYLCIRHDKRAYTQCYRDLVGFEQSAAAYERLGAAYMHIQAPEAAIEAYEQAHHMNPRDAKLAAKIGRALVSTHDYLKATDYYVTALQAHSDDILLRHDLARLFCLLHKYESAVQVLTYALEPAGSSTELSKMMQDVQSLVLLAEIYVSAEANQGEANMTMADHSVSQSLLRARDLQRSVLERCRREMESVDVVQAQRQLMGKICRKLAHFFRSELEEKAVAYFEEALTFDPLNAACLLDLARLHLKRSDLQKCESVCLSLTRVEAQHDEANMLLADVLFLRQEFDGATLKLRRVLEASPNNYGALAKLVGLLRRAGKLDEVAHFMNTAERADIRALSHPGLNFCKGLHARYSNDVVDAVKFFNLARRDGQWGVPALMNMIELYLNPDGETIWDDGADATENSEASAVADQLFKELETFIPPNDLALKIRVLGAYVRLATRTKANVDDAMQTFIDILEARFKDYLPALLGMSTAFMLEKSSTKARNALKRIAKMPYNHDLADDFERGYLLLADMYIQKAKFDLAEDLCNRCLKYNQSCGRAWETTASIREKEASYKDAAELYEKAWKLEHEASATVGFKLAFNYLKAKRFVEAIDICNKILTLYPDYPKIKKEILDKAMDALRP